MGAANFPMKRLHNVKTEMSLGVLAYNLTRVMNIMGARPLSAAIWELLAIVLVLRLDRSLLEASHAP